MEEQKAGWGFKAAAALRKSVGSLYKPTFWLKEGESAKVIFLDGEPLPVKNHRVELRSGKFRGYTCRGAGCSLCPINDAWVISVFRVIDTRTYVGKDKKSHVNEEKYFEANTYAEEALGILAATTPLKGRFVTLTRMAGNRYMAVAGGLVKNPIAPKLKILEDYKAKTAAELETVAATIGTAHPEIAGAPDPVESPAKFYEEAETETAQEAPPPVRKPAGTAAQKFQKRTQEAAPQPTQTYEEETDDLDQNGDAEEYDDQDPGPQEM